MGTLRWFAFYRLWTALVISVALSLASAAPAQNLIDPSQSVGSVPTFGGTGLTGLYYDNLNGYYGSQGSAPEASFTSSNLCFPDCLGSAFSDGGGGLQAFTNGNATNFNFFTDIEPVRLTWNNSEIDMSGYIAITTPGVYTFTAADDDYFAITIGGVTSAFGCCGAGLVFQDQFTSPGLYRMSTLFQESGGGSYMQLSATDPNGNCIFGCYDANNNLEANNLFYSDADLMGAPVPVIGSGFSWCVLAALAGLEAIRRRRTARLVRQDLS